MPTAIIVDDEINARKSLRKLVAGADEEIDVIAEAADVQSAVTICLSRRPDLIFLDINLRGHSGFDIINRLPFEPAIIFTTAYEEYALKSFELNTIDYLLKPVTEERLNRSLEKARRFLQDRSNKVVTNLQSHVLQKENVLTPFSLSAKEGNKIFLIPFEQIVFIESEDKYSYVQLESGKRILTDYQISIVEEKLPKNFLRIQKSYIVNINFIREIHRYSNSRFKIFLCDPQKSELVSGPNYYDVLKTTFFM